MFLLVILVAGVLMIAVNCDNRISQPLKMHIYAQI